eukprot:2735018-Rhodomonas_salina.2
MGGGDVERGVQMEGNDSEAARLAVAKNINVKVSAAHPPRQHQEHGRLSMRRSEEEEQGTGGDAG